MNKSAFFQPTKINKLDGLSATNLFIRRQVALTESPNRFRELDALIAAGFGDTAGTEIPDDALSPKFTVVNRPEWSSAHRVLVRPYGRPKYNDLSKIMDNEIPVHNPRKRDLAGYHDHRWTRMGKYDGAPRFRCKRCGRTRTVSNKIDRRRRQVALALGDGRSIRRIAIDTGISKNTVFRIKKLVEAGLL